MTNQFSGRTMILVSANTRKSEKNQAEQLRQSRARVEAKGVDMNDLKLPSQLKKPSRHTTMMKNMVAKHNRNRLKKQELGSN